VVANIYGRGREDSAVWATTNDEYDFDPEDKGRVFLLCVVTDTPSQSGRPRYE
jgi:hypothetical protein